VVTTEEGLYKQCLLVETLRFSKSVALLENGPYFYQSSKSY
jgi:hypothetical protein